MSKKRTKAHNDARLAAEKAGEFLEPLTYKAISGGIFKKPGLDEKDTDYSFSWVMGELRRNNDKVAEKLIKYAKNLS